MFVWAGVIQLVSIPQTGGVATVGLVIGVKGLGFVVVRFMMTVRNL